SQTEERRLLRRLRDYGIARGEGARDLTGKDCEREIPRTDAGKDAAAVELELVALADRPGKELGHAEFRARLQRVVAAEIGRFAHLRHCVGIGTLALTDDE